MNLKKFLSALLLTAIILMMFTTSFSAVNIKEVNMELDVKSAVLMDANTGTILYSYNSEQPLAPASVTKIMTLLLIFEAINEGKLSYTDKLTVSENASSMGGSQIFLEPGEEMMVDDLLKSVIIASANDAALTLAENVGGSEEAFVSMMNNKAEELGMTSTHFENVTGLDDVVNHLTSAKDIAIMSRELLKYDKVSEYATIWMDTIRNGEFGLTNTNRLIRFYKGITGLKTGYTSKAGYCVSASAKRDNLHLIAVIMGAETSQIRNNAATKLLDFGFANYSVYESKNNTSKTIKVCGGTKDEAYIQYDDYFTLLNKGDEKRIEKEVQLAEYLVAPVLKNEVVGKVIYKIDGEIVGESNIICQESVEKISFFEYLFKILKNIF